MEPQHIMEKIIVIAALEAILFLHGEPMSIDQILKIVKKEEDLKHTTKGEIQNALRELQGKLDEEGRGLMLITSPGGAEAQLATRPAFAPLLEEFMKEEFTESLSPASLETLALIAYLGPLSRASLDYYRGVNSSFILRSLLIRGLIDRKPDPHKGHVYLYQASFDLLKYMGVKTNEDLPEYQKFKHLHMHHEEIKPANDVISQKPTSGA